MPYYQYYSNIMNNTDFEINSNVTIDDLDKINNDKLSLIVYFDNYSIIGGSTNELDLSLIKEEKQIIIPNNHRNVVLLQDNYHLLFTMYNEVSLFDLLSIRCCNIQL